MNLAATVADNSDGGLFVERDSALAEACQFSMQWPLNGRNSDDSHQKCRTGKVIQDVVCVPEKFSERQVDKSVLNMRAL